VRDKKRSSAFPMKKLRHIRDLVLKNTYRYLAGVLCLLVVDILQLVLPSLLGRLTDYLKAGSLTPGAILTYAFIIIAMAAGIASFRFLWRFLILGVSKRIEADLRERFYLHLQKLGATYYSTHKTGDLMAHSTNDIGNITTAAGMGIIISVDSVLIPIVALIMMVSSGGLKLTLASFAPLLLILAFFGVFMSQMESRITKMQEAFSNMTEKIGRAHV
jgi:ATP-binding cassette, subfamily B, multidrug efflux pump